MIEPHEVLFVGAGKSAVLWYRCALPAYYLGADWIGVFGEPPRPYVATGLVKGMTQFPKWGDYKVVVLQQVAGQRWLGLIRDLQRRGVKVIYEVDDYLHGVRKQQDHDFKEGYSKERLARIELCMRVCDAMIVSTPWLGRKYRAFNKRVYICENGIDLNRYNLTKPERKTVTIGWAGATGHMGVVVPWLNIVAKVMKKYDHVCFAAVGQPAFAEGVGKYFSEERTIGVPWTMIENYPAAMTMFDIAMAPAGKTSWWKGKSDLRWLEAGALHTPIIADPDLYPKIEPGVSGFHARTYGELQEAMELLVNKPELRKEVGDAAYTYVVENRDITKTCGNWMEVFRRVIADKPYGLDD